MYYVKDIKYIQSISILCLKAPSVLTVYWFPFMGNGVGISWRQQEFDRHQDTSCVFPPERGCEKQTTLYYVFLFLEEQRK